jgi:hypothetical protein
MSEPPRQQRVAANEDPQAGAPTRMSTSGSTHGVVPPPGIDLAANWQTADRDVNAARAICDRIDSVEQTLSEVRGILERRMRRHSRPNRREARKTITETLITFVDFLYAVVFGLILADTSTSILQNDRLPIWPTKAMRLLLVLAMFYGLLWDWLHGRLLTKRNHYRRYGRFFLEILIAFSGYGAAIESVRSSVFCLFYISLVLLFGAVWAWTALYEFRINHDTKGFKSILRVLVKQRDVKDIADGQELRAIVWMQVLFATVGLLAWALRVGDDITMSSMETGLVVIVGWLFILCYELCLPRVAGIAGGPGVPFVSKKSVRRLRAALISVVPERIRTIALRDRFLE